MDPAPASLARQRAAVMGTLVAAVIWGTSFPVIRWGLTEGGLDPYTFSFFRFTLGAGLVAGVAASLGALRASLFRDPWVWALGALNGAAFFLQFLGQTMTTASNAALLVNVNAVTVAFFAWALLRERIGRGSLLALALGMGGVVLVSTRGEFDALAAGTWRGDLVVLASGFVWGLFAVATKRVVGAAASMTGLLAAVLVFTAVALAPAALLLGDASPGAVTGRGWAAILYTALFPTLLAFLLWQSGLRFIGATVSALLLLTEVLVAVVVSVAWLNESLTLASAFGALLILLAVVLATRAPERAGPEAAAEMHEA